MNGLSLFKNVKHFSYHSLYRIFQVFESGSKYPSIEENKSIEESTDLAIEEKILLFTSPLKEPILGQCYKAMGNFKDYITKPAMDTSILVIISKHYLVVNG